MSPSTAVAKAALHLDDALRCSQHIRIRNADDHNIVRVMGDRAGNRATLQTEPSHIAHAHSSGCLVALDAGDLEQIALDIG